MASFTLNLESFKQKMKVFSELVMFNHTIFSASFILIAMIVSSVQVNNTAFFGFKTLILCAISLITARNFAMGFNRLCDRDIDSDNERTKNRPSVDGRVSPPTLTAFCVINAAAFVLTSYFINDLAFYLSVPFLVILGVYSFMKRFSYLAHVVLGVSLGLTPIAGDIAVSGTLHLWCIFLSIGVLFWVAGFDILYSLQDINYDKEHNLYSIPVRFGVENSLHISRIFHIFAVFFWALFLRFSPTHNLAIIGLIVSAGMLVYEHYLVSRDFKNIPRAFFTTNGYLGFVFLAFIIFDSILRY
ncbi:4-hydroxybenzoate polyprenyltransferase [Helicobacter saguini]|uniref:4-hydroxybenzoate polyprenyltransferase n=1 Tax=Helicobacter saguini TaxID=1548018 RepID=A0A347VN31_9HELI|nr:menaquinone biosynthesis prenyltransferase MqnP [Helicobacter saguini]MWV61923.1 4-hydroxybenzoate polyprenyltransferase [Helicobacter saguini]MWV67402.1 4-hydroxybenzoate polyprenyltransferase [Helicobacter saguini]MWV69755.1 4-hydroxybenzoate polyprenyltransferase [Helicobacter saguini]MWV73028.1 4-hydroxybenzoate polyprenyltransferase [Helicobacter saguini]TLD95596.1 4-hydroxybenzoate polyprenyltransferase [Helicobacter saguini]